MRCRSNVVPRAPRKSIQTVVSATMRSSDQFIVSTSREGCADAPIARYGCDRITDGEGLDLEKKQVASRRTTGGSFLGLLDRASVVEGVSGRVPIGIVLV